MSLTAGARLGPYEVVSRLGEGGMGEVYRARDTRLDRIVALKVLPPDRVADAEARGRFEREAKAIAALSHPNICAIHDVGLADSGSAPYLVMELLEGQTLQERLLRGPLDVDQVVDYGVALADALDTAHARGLIHRDLKPANILITTRGIPKILDFGLAKALSPGPNHLRHGYGGPPKLHAKAEDPGLHSRDVDVTRSGGDALTELGTTVGTVAYMSPEQLRGEILDVRSDLFSFGLVLYEMATGQRAFAGATSAVVSAAILMQEPAPPTTVRTGLPTRLEETILKALEKDRDVRCQSAAELRADLMRLKRQSGAQTTRASVAAVPMPPRTAITTMSGTGPATSSSTSSARSGTATSAKPTRGFLAALAVIGVGVLIGGGYWLGVGGNKGGSPNAPPQSGPPPSSAPDRGLSLESTPPAVRPTARASAATAPAATPAITASATTTPTPIASPPPASSTPPPPQAAVNPATVAGQPARGDAGSLPPGPPRGGRDAGGRRGLGPGGPALVSVLKTLPPLPFDLAYAARDDRAREMAMQLRNALTAAGWTNVNTAEVPNPPAALAVFIPQASPSATALVNWARRAGFNPEVRPAPRAPRLRVVIGR